MSQDQLDKARQLIEKQKYEQARAILQPLAFSDDVAKDMLERLNAIAPPGAAPKKRSGCMAAILGGGIVTLLAVGGCLVLCVIIVAVAAMSGGATTDKALEANGGLGEQEKPIAAGQPVVFDDFTITPISLEMNATQRVNQLNSFNEAPAVGTQYVLGRFKMECKKTGSEVCRGAEMKVRLVDDAGAEWGEPSLIVLGDEAIDGKELIGGTSFEGIVAFEFPETGKTIALIKLWETGGATLYTEPPAAD